MNTDFAKRTVFVSSGTSGLGAHVSEYFVKLGYSVVICARNQDSLLSKVGSLKSLSNAGQQVHGFVCDVSDVNSVATVFEKLKEIEFSIDVLICNAGVIGPIDKFLKNDKQQWESAFNINLYGTINLVTEVLPSMILNRSGRIIHISGGGATSPLFGMTSYAASKAAAVRFIETLALEYVDSGVTMNSIAPGMLKTQLLDQMLEAGPSRVGENLYSKSSAKSKAESDTTELALGLIAFLASDASEGITGKLISAEWDNWSNWPDHVEELKSTDMYTLRRIVGRDRGQSWGDL